VFYKIFSLKIILPKRTWRILILASLILLSLISLFYWGYFHQFLFVYIVLPALLVFNPIYVVFWNFITNWFFDYIKEKKYKEASEKLKKYKKLYKIWITWSYWKSSMKEYLSTLLWEKYNIIKTPENVNTEIWIANFVLNTDFSKYDFFIAEMWAYRKWEITTCSKIVNQKDAFLTGLGNQHIWLFGSQQNIIDAKFEIWSKVLENNWKLYLNNANIIELNQNTIHIKDELWIIDFKWKTPEIVKKLLEKDKIIFYGKYIKILDQNEKGTKFMVKNHIFETKLIWRWQLINLQWAILYALDNWINPEKIQNWLKKLKQPKNTLEFITNEYEIEKLENWKLIKEKYKVRIIDDTYNLSVNGLLNAVDTIQNFKWKKILILDDILELWKFADKIHYKLWQYLWKIFNEIMFVGINYKDQFEKWVNEVWWKIINKLWTTPLEETTFLFEGKKASRELKKILQK